ncbi:endo-13(4)-beta-glucanase 1-like [Trifolium medium]|uniref:Endo-13(4)-beta-glucanase 1-like n=1 Tax=Trifolium medium TaxID=97028 RepID=A0A392P0G0_9FABA|nr:endo-13(4)-beta-glucanase 1-like [Trifolium medium]
MPFVSLSSNDNLTKFTFHLNNDQTWLGLGPRSVLLLKVSSSILSSANLGDAVLRESYSVEYKFEKKGSGDFLMLALSSSSSAFF